MAQFAAAQQDIANAEEFKLLQSQFPEEHPYTLERFLIARDFHVGKATEMLEKHIEWRQQNLPVNRDEIINEASKGICVMKGRSKEGYPIVYARTRFQQPLERNLDEALRGGIYILEKAMAELGDKKDTSEGKFILILDRVDSTRANVDMEFWKQLARIALDNYPERLHKVLVYPANILFRSVWAVFKYFLDARTREKVELLGYPEGLLAHIEPSELLADVGGQIEYTFNLDDI